MILPEIVKWALDGFAIPKWHTMFWMQQKLYVENKSLAVSLPDKRSREFGVLQRVI